MAARHATSVSPRLFAFTMAALAAACACSARGGQLLFVDIFVPSFDDGSIRMVDDSGDNLNTLISTGGGLRAIDIDHVGRKIYWVDVNVPSIRRANFNGSNQQILVTANVVFPSAIAVDPAGGKLYWGDQVSEQLWRANLDGSSPQLLRFTPFHRGIALDTVNGKVYWSTSESAWKGEIHRCNLNGTNLETVITSQDAEFKPSAIALDIAGGKIYWTDYVVDKVRRANLNNTSVQTLFSIGFNANPRGITLDLAAGKLYFGQDIDFRASSSTIWRMDLDGALPEPLVEELGLANYLVFCQSPICLTDVNGDAAIDVVDLLAVVNAWGDCPAGDCLADVNGSGAVDVVDLLDVIGDWGPCQ